MLADVDPAELGPSAPTATAGRRHADVLRWLAGPGGEIGSLDALLVGRGEAGPVLPRRDDLDDHPRVRRAREHRRDVEVYGDDAGLVVLGRGLVGPAGDRRRAPSTRRRPAAPGTAAADPRRPGAPRRPASRCWAQVSPGNAQSLRAFLACGFVPIGSEVLLHP